MRAGKAGRLYLMGLGMLLAALGMVFIIALWKGYEKASETRRWRATPCEIVAAWIQEAQFSEPGDRRYLLELRYRYEFAGHTYVGRRVTRRDGATRSRPKLERLLTFYRPGTQTQCFVDPADPDSAVLRHESRAPGYTLWFPLLFVVSGATMAAAAARRSGRTRDRDGSSR
ncbi:MAG TPA: DUF3592 domain-containing protein [Verrucomicrobiales bacterium]|nr:DUF3592 domain-containing protein [Verrucomicrobiales bacterium]